MIRDAAFKGTKADSLTSANPILAALTSLSCEVFFDCLCPGCLVKRRM